MAVHAALLGPSKTQSTLLVLFIPSRDRFDQPIDQAIWPESVDSSILSIVMDVTVHGPV